MNISSQVTQQWAARYNSIGNLADYPVSVKTDANGYVYVAGSSLISTGNFDYNVIKYSSSGIQQWVVNYNGPGNKNDILNSMVIDNAGNVFVTGNSYTDSVTLDDCLTVKYNSNGILQWIARYDQNHLSEAGREIALDNSGNVYITGGSLTNSINYDFLTIKYTSSGIQQWVSILNGLANRYDYSSELVIDNIGNIYVSGQSQNGTGLHQTNFLTVKYSPAGVQQWSAMYNGPPDSADTPKCIYVDSLNNIYVGGDSRGSGTNTDIAVVKYNSAGVQQWAARYNGSGNSIDNCAAIVVSPSGTVYVTGGTTVNSFDCVIIKYNISGTQQWVNTYNGAFNGFDGYNDIALDKTGNVVVTGYTEINANNVDYFTVKYNSNGSTQWIKTYDGGINGDDVAYKIIVDTLNNVYVSGISKGAGTGDDIVTIKYSQVVAVTPISNQIPGEYKLHQNFPNPFNPSTTIKFDIPVSEIVNISVYDITGKEAANLADEFMVSGSYEINFDATMLSSGTYFYQLQAGSYTETKKMIIIK